jgi:sterol carrier protein 2
MTHEVAVAGVGMIPFVKPGTNEPYPEMAVKAAQAAGACVVTLYERV